MTPILSILTASVHHRIDKLHVLSEKFYKLIGDKPVEHLVFLDNRKRSLGKKRDALVQLAAGEYLAFCDDDDNVSEDYIESLLDCISKGSSPDVITFCQETTINGESPFKVEHKLGNTNEPASKSGDKWIDIKRGLGIHACAWKTSIAQSTRFVDTWYDEDGMWVAEMSKKVSTSEHIDKVLHYYAYDSKTTLAFAPKND